MLMIIVNAVITINFKYTLLHITSTLIMEKNN